MSRVGGDDMHRVREDGASWSCSCQPRAKKERDCWDWIWRFVYGGEDEIMGNARIIQGWDRQRITQKMGIEKAQGRDIQTHP